MSASLSSAINLWKRTQNAQSRSLFAAMALLGAFTPGHARADATITSQSRSDSASASGT
jgi:hypothetical protein